MKQHLNFLLLFLLSIEGACNHKNKISVSDLLAKHQLKLISHFTNDAHTINYSTYGNYSDSTFLTIATNIKGDTLLKHFYLYESNSPAFYKIGNNYVVEINGAYRDPRYYEKTGSGYDGDMYFQDSVHYFIADTLNYILSALKRPTDDSLIAMSKHTFGLKGNFKMVHPPFSKWFTISKDTLDSLQVYYMITNHFKITEEENKPVISAFPESLYQSGIYNKNKIIFNDFIGCSDNAADPFCLYTEWHQKFSQKYFFYNQIHETEEIVLAIKRKNTESERKIILRVPKSNFKLLQTPGERNANAETLSEARIDMMKFYGNYFISVFLPYEDEYNNELPPVFLLDTLNWKLSEIKAFEKSAAFKNKVVQETERRLILSEDYRNRVSNFMRSFTIIKTTDGYFLSRQ